MNERLLVVTTNPRNIFKFSSSRWKRDIGANGASCIRAPSRAKFSPVESDPNTTEINILIINFDERSLIVDTGCVFGVPVNPVTAIAIFVFVICHMLYF